MAILSLPASGMSSSTEIVVARYRDVVEISRNMRPADADEILPLIWGHTPENLAALVLAGGELIFVARHGSTPVAAFGAVEIKPSNWQVWAFATPQWPKVVLAVSKYLRRRIMPIVEGRGGNRAECWSLSTHTDAHRWIEMMGGEREATVSDYGPHRKTYHLYAWTRTRMEEKKDVYFRRCQGGARAAHTDAGGAAIRADSVAIE